MEKEIRIQEVGIKINRKISKKKSRKLQALPNQWKRNVNMLNRDLKKAYTDYKNRHVPEKSSAFGQELYKEKCRLKC